MASSAANPNRRLNKIVGAFSLIIFALLALTFILSSRKDLLDTRDDYYLISYFTEVGLLQKGAPVKYAGIQIGRVTCVDLLPNHNIKVECSVVMTKKIPTDSKLSVAATTISGDTFINLIIGTAPTTLAHADNPKDAPVLKGLNFINISNIGSIFTDMAGATTSLTTSITRLFSKDSFTLLQARQAISSLPKLKAEFKNINLEKAVLAEKIETAKTGFSNIKRKTKYSIKNIFDSYPLEKISDDMAKISSSMSEVNSIIESTTKNKNFISIKDDISSINNWAKSLKIAKNSILAVMLSDGCGGIKRTIKMVGKSVKTAQDFSLFKLLGFYMDGKRLLARFEERTHAEYLPASAYMYRWSVFSYKRYQHNCDLPSGAKCCPKELR